MEQKHRTHEFRVTSIWVTISTGNQVAYNDRKERDRAGQQLAVSKHRPETSIIKTRR